MPGKHRLALERLKALHPDSRLSDALRFVPAEGRPLAFVLLCCDPSAASNLSSKR